MVLVMAAEMEEHIRCIVDGKNVAQPTRIDDNNNKI